MDLLDCDVKQILNNLKLINILLFSYETQNSHFYNRWYNIKHNKGCRETFLDIKITKNSTHFQQY